MNTNTIGFFKKFILSITDQRLYPFIVKEGLFRALLYFINLILIASIVLAFVATGELFDTMPEYIDRFEQKAPEFSILNGKLQLEEEADFSLSENIYIYFLQEGKTPNSVMTFDNVKNSKYSTYVVFDSDSIEFHSVAQDKTIAKMLDVKLSEFQNLSKSDLVKAWRDYADEQRSRFFVFLFFVVTFFIAYGIIRLGTLVMYTISTALLDVLFKTKIRGRDYFKIAIYVSSLPVVLETFALSRVKSIPDVAEIIEIIIAMIYIFVALKACKITSIIETVSGAVKENAEKQEKEENREDNVKQEKEESKEDKNDGRDE